MGDNNSLEELKGNIRCILIAERDGIPLKRLNKAYLDVVGEDIDFDKNVHKDLKDFLLSIPDTCRVEDRRFETFVFPIVLEEQLEVIKLIQDQRDNKYQAERKKRMKINRQKYLSSQRNIIDKNRNRSSYRPFTSNFNLSNNSVNFNNVGQLPNLNNRSFKSVSPVGQTRRRRISPTENNSSPTDNHKRSSRDFNSQDVYSKYSATQRMNRTSRSPSKHSSTKSSPNKRSRSRSRKRLRRSRSRSRSRKRLRRSRSRSRSRSRKHSPIRPSSRRNRSRSPRRRSPIKSSPRRSRSRSKSPFKSKRCSSFTEKLNEENHQKHSKYTSSNKSTSNESKNSKHVKSNSSIDNVKEYLTKDSPLVKAPINSTTRVSSDDPKMNTHPTKQSLNGMIQSKESDKSNKITAKKISSSFDVRKTVPITVFTPELVKQTEKMKNSFDIRDKVPVEVFTPSSIKNVEKQQVNEQNREQLTMNSQEISQRESEKSRDPRLRCPRRLSLADHSSNENTKRDQSDDESNEKVSKWKQRIRDYSPDYRREKVNESSSRIRQSSISSSMCSLDDENEQQINNNRPTKTATTKTPIPPINEYNRLRIPLITNESLRSYEKRSQRSVIESDSVSEDGVVFKEDDFDDDCTKYDQFTDEQKEILKPKMSLDIIEISELELTKKLILNAIITMPALFCSSRQPETEQCNLFFTNKEEGNEQLKNYNTEQIYYINDGDSNFDSSINYIIQLNEFINEYNLPKPKYNPGVLLDENSSNLTCYFCGLSIGDLSWCVVLRSTKSTPEDAKNSVSKIALEILKKNQAENDEYKQKENNEKIINNIVKLFETKTENVCDNVLKRRYQDLYQQKICPNWLDLVKSSNCFSVKELKIQDNPVLVVKLKS